VDIGIKRTERRNATSGSVQEGASDIGGLDTCAVSSASTDFDSRRTRREFGGSGRGDAETRNQRPTSHEKSPKKISANKGKGKT